MLTRPFIHLLDSLSNFCLSSTKLGHDPDTPILKWIVLSTSSPTTTTKPSDKHHLMAFDPKTILPVTSFSLQRRDYMTPCPMVHIS